MEFYSQALRKTMKRKTKVGVGITILNNRMYGERMWRPLLPLEFEKAYPCMCKLIKRCWAPLKEDRPGFEEIVKVMQGEIADEVRRKEEPAIVVYEGEADGVDQDRLGVKEDFWEEEGRYTTTTSFDTSKVVTLKEYEKVLEEIRGGRRCWWRRRRRKRSKMRCWWRRRRRKRSMMR